MSAIVDCGKAVLAALNAGTWSQTFAAVRQRLVVIALTDMSTLHVSVVEKSVTVDLRSRGELVKVCVVDVAVQIRPTAVDADSVDPFVNLIEELADWFLKRRLPTFPSAVCVDVTIDPIYAADHLDKLRQFTSVLSLTFEVYP